MGGGDAAEDGLTEPDAEEDIGDGEIGEDGSGEESRGGAPCAALFPLEIDAHVQFALCRRPPPPRNRLSPSRYASSSKT